jgi:hypothetical protein
MCACQYRTVRVVDYFDGGGTKQHSPENACVCGHDDQVESTISSDLGDFGGRITGGRNSGKVACRKFCGEKRIELFPTYAEMFSLDLEWRPFVEFEATIVGGIDDVNERDLGPSRAVARLT